MPRPSRATAHYLAKIAPTASVLPSRASGFVLRRGAVIRGAARTVISPVTVGCISLKLIAERACRFGTAIRAELGANELAAETKNRRNVKKPGYLGYLAKNSSVYAGFSRLGE